MASGNFKPVIVNYNEYKLPLGATRKTLEKLPKALIVQWFTKISISPLWL
jgi:hypothetical protein